MTVMEPSTLKGLIRPHGNWRRVQSSSWDVKAMKQNTSVLLELKAKHGISFLCNFYANFGLIYFLTPKFDFPPL